MFARHMGPQLPIVHIFRDILATYCALLNPLSYAFFAHDVWVVIFHLDSARVPAAARQDVTSDWRSNATNLEFLRVQFDNNIVLLTSAA